MWWEHKWHTAPGAFFCFCFFSFLPHLEVVSDLLLKKTCGTEHGIHSLIWFEELHQVYLHILTNKHIAVDSGLIFKSSCFKIYVINHFDLTPGFKVKHSFLNLDSMMLLSECILQYFQTKKYINITQIKSGSYILPRTSPHWKYWKISTSGRYFELEAAEPKVFLSGFFSVPAIP